MQWTEKAIVEVFKNYLKNIDTYNVGLSA